MRHAASHRPGRRRACQAGAALAVLCCLSGRASGADVEAGPRQEVWTAGAYTFSDELGGFRILRASGRGTAADPVVLEQELLSASPVTVVIRARGAVQPFGRPGSTPNGFLHVRILARNASGVAWVGFGFELQEVLGQPSVFGDGLSFDQRRSASDGIGSDAFASYERDFEPHDRLLFQQGAVDPAQTGGFRFLVTDMTPRQTFFLLEDPRIPSS